jgi:hypothetical protein
MRGVEGEKQFLHLVFGGEAAWTAKGSGSK